MLVFGAGNRDPDAFDDPDAIRFDRTKNRHLAFGGGIHRCLGSNLGRRELVIALEEFLRIVPTFTAEQPAESWHGVGPLTVRIDRGGGSMRVSIDPGLCQGHARCASLVPELFDIDDEGYGVRPAGVRARAGGRPAGAARDRQLPGAGDQARRRGVGRRGVAAADQIGSVPPRFTSFIVNCELTRAKPGSSARRFM